MVLEYADVGEIDTIAKAIIDFSGDHRVWVFDGEMGAGKTTLIKSICRQMNVQDNVSSPTFALVNVYEAEDGEDMYHFDFYRIKTEMEALDIGCEEYFYSGSYCFIEWAEKIPALVPPKNLKISIKLAEENLRKIILTKNDE